MGMFRSRSDSPQEVSLSIEEDSASWPVVTPPPPPQSDTHLNTSSSDRRERIILLLIISIWYLVGVGAIVTTKILLTDWHVPPLLLTFQQLTCASTLLRLVLTMNGSFVASPCSEKSFHTIWHEYADFLLAGMFNALDFLSSNTGFSHAAASFVETIKSTDPLFTTAVALAWNIDVVTSMEAMALALLIGGIMLSTWGNQQGLLETTMLLPTQTQLLCGSLIVMIANICFAFRCMFQKRYRASSIAFQVDDANLLCRLQQVGASALLIPTTIAYTPFVWKLIWATPHSDVLYYFRLSLINSICYVSYNWASTYCLSKLSVLQYSSLGCLRRLFAIVATCVFFGVPMTWIGALGLLTSVFGFLAFTYLRNERRYCAPAEPSPLKKASSLV